MDGDLGHIEAFSGAILEAGPHCAIHKFLPPECLREMEAGGQKCGRAVLKTGTYVQHGAHAFESLKVLSLPATLRSKSQPACGRRIQSVSRSSSHITDVTGLSLVCCMSCVCMRRTEALEALGCATCQELQNEASRGKRCWVVWLF